MTRPLKDQLDRIETKQDQTADRIGQIDVTLARQAATLDEHQRRSLANEQSVELLRTEMKPLAMHVAITAAFAKWVVLLGTVVGTAVGVAKLFHWI